MKQRPSQYPSAKFAALTDSESIVNTKKNYYTWIISVTVIFGVAVGFLCYKLFIGPHYFNNTLPQSHTVDNDSFTTTTPRNLKPKVVRPEITLPKKISRDNQEFACEQTQPQLEAIQLALRKKVLQQLHAEDVYHYINADLLAHYERIINKHDSRYLKSVFNEYRLKLSAVRYSIDFVDFLKGLTSNKFKFYVSYLKKQKFQLKLNEFYWFFALTEELNQWYNYLSRLRSFLSYYEQQSRRKSFGNITSMNFDTFTEETQKKLFRFVYPFSVTEKKLVEINEILSEWTKPLHLDRNNFSLAFSNKVVLLSEVVEQLQALNVSGLKNVYLYANRVLYLDTHLELPGINLAIIAPKWEFVKKVRINLDGIAGKEHSSGTAPAGHAGIPGNPGGNAGDFLGVGSFQDKLLLISANGGAGGRGQNGAQGHDGLNNTRPGPVFGKPDCVIQIKNYKNLFNLNITHYEIYSEAGCGGPGTDGGVGGEGGQGGTITLMSKNSVKVIKGFKGASGLPGKGGPGGIGGRNGCFYEAVDENDEFLHPITRVKCPTGNVLPSGRPGKDNCNTRGQVLPSAKENLSVHHCIHCYIRLARKNFVEYNDPHVLSFLKELNKYGETKLEDMLRDFKSVEKFDRVEFYQLFKEKLHERFRVTENSSEFPYNYLKSIILGEMMYLKNNINYFFIDTQNYLNILKTALRDMNENTRELKAVAYFKGKIEIKFDKLKQNLRLLKQKLRATEVLFRNDTNYSSEGLLEKRISCVLLVTIDIINFLMDESSLLTSLELNNSIRLCSMNAQPNSENPSQTPAPYHYKNSPLKDLSDAEGILLRFLPPAFENKLDFREYLMDLKGALDGLEESNVVSEKKKKLLLALIDEVEHFISLYHFIEWEELEKMFSKSLNELTRVSSWNASNEFLKSRLLDVVAAVQLKLGVEFSRQKFYPLRTTNALPSHRNKTLSDLLSQLKDRDLRDRSPFCKNHMKAIFDVNSTVGEFFSWTNAEIRNELIKLFSGVEINLKSNLINRHVLDKSFLQFNSLKLDFYCLGKESLCVKLRDALSNYKIDITHSGYSYYNWGDETHVVVSEKVTLSYSFKTRNNQEPELYNAIYRKCQDGEINLSPFTTWTVRLIPVNEKANFTKLAMFGDIVSLNLVGTGTYIV